MIPVTFTNSGITYDKNIFYQYDYGQKLEIHGLDLPDTIQVHFARKGATTASNIGHTTEGITVVNIPDDIFLYSGEFNVYLYEISETSGKTLRNITFYVRERSKPLDYEPQAITQSSTADVTNEELVQRILALEAEVNQLKVSTDI